MSSFAEIATRIISDLADVAVTADDGELLRSVRQCTKLHIADFDNLIHTSGRMRTATVTKEECDLLREEGTKVFQV